MISVPVIHFGGLHSGLEKNRVGVGETLVGVGETISALKIESF